MKTSLTLLVVFLIIFLTDHIDQIKSVEGNEEIVQPKLEHQSSMNNVEAAKIVSPEHHSSNQKGLIETSSSFRKEKARFSPNELYPERIVTTKESERKSIKKFKNSGPNSKSAILLHNERKRRDRAKIKALQNQVTGYH